jgi:hypothetical protein
MYKRINRVSGSLFVAGFLTSLPLTITKGTKLTGGGWTIGFLWGCTCAALVIWVLSTKVVRDRIPWTIIKTSDLTARGVSDKTLGAECLDLASKLHDELAEYQREDPRRLNWGFRYPSPNSLEWDEQEKAEQAHKVKFEAKFQQRFQSRAAWLLDEISKRGLADDSAIWRASPHAGMLGEHGIQELAALLSTVGHRLTKRDS